MEGEKIKAYSGDPLLDFSTSNFLDRISYKDPKSKDKIQKFQHLRTQKMSDYEKPINEYDFKNGERPDIIRVEEEFMYKYLEKIDKKQSKKEDDDSDMSDKEFDKVTGIDDQDDASDPELEKFAQQEIEK